MTKLLGGILMAIGILIAGASGLCTLTFLLPSLSSRGGLGIIPLILITGGIPFAIGLGAFFGGRALIRSASKEDHSK